MGWKNYIRCSCRTWWVGRLRPWTSRGRGPAAGDRLASCAGTPSRQRLKVRSHKAAVDCGGPGRGTPSHGARCPPARSARGIPPPPPCPAARAVYPRAGLRGARTVARQQLGAVVASHQRWIGQIKRVLQPRIKVGLVRMLRQGLWPPHRRRARAQGVRERMGRWERGRVWMRVCTRSIMCTKKRVTVSLYGRRTRCGLRALKRSSPFLTHPPTDRAQRRRPVGMSYARLVVRRSSTEHAPNELKRLVTRMCSQVVPRHPQVTLAPPVIPTAAVSARRGGR